MAAALPGIIGGVGGVLQGVGASRPRTSTSTQESQSSQTANLTGRQGKVDKALFKQILEYLKRGPEVSQSDRNFTRGQINDQYEAMDDRLASHYAGSGFEGSGKEGAGFRSNELDRLRTTQDAESGLRSQAQNRFMQMIQSAFQFNTPRSFNSTQSGTSTSTMPGQSGLGMFGQGLGDLSSLLFMRNMGAFGGGAPSFSPSQIGGIQAGMSHGYPCHIAMELYGASDWRTLYLRSHLLARAETSVKWALAVALYKATGKALARVIRKSERARGMFRLMFDRLLQNAISA